MALVLILIFAVVIVGPRVIEVATVRSIPVPAPQVRAGVAPDCEGSVAAAGSETSWVADPRQVGRSGMVLGVRPSLQDTHTVIEFAEKSALERTALANLPGTAGEFAVAPGGKHALIVSQGPGSGARDDLRLVDLETGQVDRSWRFDFLEVSGLTWAPDASAFAVLTRHELLRGSRTDGGLVRIAAASNSTATPVAWSPDGAWIAYSVDEVTLSGLKSHIRLIRPDGSDARQLGVGSNRTDVAWSPGGRLLAFSNGDGVTISTPDGDEVHQLLFVQDGVAMTELSWSPRGDAIAFASSREIGALRPCVATSDGGMRRLVDCGGDFITARLRWSPDGAALLAPTSSCNGNTPEMRIVDVAGVREDVVVPYLWYPDWVPTK